MIRILFILLCVSIGVKAQQEAPPSYYFGIYASGVQSRSTGPFGFEKQQYYTDLIEDFKSKGYSANGGLFPKYSFGFGGLYGHYLSDQFTLETALGIEQKGYFENLTYNYSNDELTIDYKNKADVSLAYIDWLIGIKYYNEYGWSIHTGAVLSVNFIDNVNVDYEETFTSVDSSYTNSFKGDRYFNNHFGYDREIYTPGYFLALGYKIGRFELEAMIKQEFGIYYEDKREQNVFIANARLSFNIFQ